MVKSANPPRKIGHPFIQQLRRLKPNMSATLNAGTARKARQEEGTHMDRQATGIFKRINHLLLEEILRGQYIPDPNEVAMLAEDYGLKRGNEDYNQFYAQGQQYYELYHRDNQPPRPRSEPKTSEEAVAEPTDLKSALQHIRASRYYFPFGKHREDPVITTEQYNELPPSHRQNAKPLKLLQINTVFVGYSGFEAGKVPITDHSLLKIMDALHCTQSERDMLRTFYNPLPDRSAPRMDPADGVVFSQYRLKKELAQGELAKLHGIKPGDLSLVENGKATQFICDDTLHKLGFKSMDELRQTERELPETESSKTGHVPRYVPKMKLTHGLIFKRYCLKDGYSLAEVVKKTHITAQSVHNIETGNATETLFKYAVKKLGFRSITAMVNSEAKMPDNEASLSGKWPDEPRRRPTTSPSRG